MKNIIQKAFVTFFSSVFTFLLAVVAPAAPPANDNFAGAEQLSGIQVHITRNNFEATKEPNEPHHAGNEGGKSSGSNGQPR